MKLTNSLILFVVAIILSAVIGPIGIIYTLRKIVCRIFIPTTNRPMVKAIGYISNTLRGVAKGIDQLGNVVCRDFFNDILIEKNGYSFGDVGETISSVLGKNERGKTLTGTGQWLVNILNKIEPNHCKKSIIYIFKEKEGQIESEHWWE